jgi:hypothetical protein
MARPVHLVKRFFGMLVPLPVSRADDEWAEAELLPSEVDLWRQMRRADRRHAVGVARRTSEALGPAASRPVLAAALLHDVGKVDSHLGTYGRVAATLSAAMVKHDPDVIKAWTRTKGFTRRVGLYLQHPKLGGDMLGMAGSDPLTEAWAREHHLPADEWTVPAEVGAALKHADDD